MGGALDKILVDDWRCAHKFWSLWLALFWGALNGLVLGLPFLSGYVNPWVLLAANMIGYGLIGLARLLKQPGLP